MARSWYPIIVSHRRTVSMGILGGRERVVMPHNFLNNFPMGNCRRLSCLIKNHHHVRLVIQFH